MKRKVLSLIISLALLHSMVLPVSAYERPTTPTDPGEAPDAPSYWDPTPTPAPTVQPTPEPTQIPQEPTPTPTPKPKKPKPTPTPVLSVTEPVDNQEAPVVVNQPVLTVNAPAVEENSGATANHDNLEGPISIESGNVQGDVSVTNTANTNAAAGLDGGSTSLASVTNEGNSAEATNEGAISSENTIEINQENILELENTVEVDLNTGNNRVSDNLGGGSAIKTGDATSTVNIFNLGNTNLAGAAITSEEFNVLDDQTGDIDLSLVSTSGCGLAPCGTGNASVTNTGNGSDSNNNGVIQTGNNLIITSENFANVDNTINVEVDTGNNVIADSFGDSTIETGDANVAANIFNFINTNLAGITDLIIKTVNILEDFAGNIILPGSNSGSSQYAVNNSENGSDTRNNGSITDVTNTELNQNNTTIINNTINAEANTGNNKLKDNISGEGDINSLQTGSINSQVGVANVAGNNYIGDEVNIILYNNEGVMTAYYINEDGQLTPIEYSIENLGNGSDSENTGEIVNENNTTINQNNIATIDNTINIDANTGKNTIKDTIDGGTSIKTGDVNIITSITNFINNNILGNKLIITVVNDLFGKWTGNFVNKDEIAVITPTIAPEQLGIGGVQEQSESTTDSGVPAESLHTTASAGQGPTETTQNTQAKQPAQQQTNNNAATQAPTQQEAPAPKKTSVGLLGMMSGSFIAQTVTEANDDQETTEEIAKAHEVDASDLAQTVTPEKDDNVDTTNGLPTPKPWKVGVLLGLLLSIGYEMKRRIFGA